VASDPAMNLAAGRLGNLLGALARTLLQGSGHSQIEICTKVRRVQGHKAYGFLRELEPYKPAALRDVDQALAGMLAPSFFEAAGSRPP
jgi:hypothetical protein